MPSTRFSLQAGHWYAWEMLPGYMAEGRLMQPYYSPIFIRNIKPMKSGKNLLAVEFLNACYASGVADFELTLRVLARRYHFMIAEIADYEERCAVLSEVSFPWVEKNCPQLLEWRPVRSVFGPEASPSVTEWLDRIFS